METPPPEDIDDHDLTGALARWWALDVDRMRYLPKGSGSFHWRARAGDGQEWFVTVDDLETKPWLGHDADSTFAGLRAAYDTAHLLHRQARLGFVVAPVPLRAGGTVLRLGPRYGLSVFPCVAGQAGTWGESIEPGERDDLVALLAELHRATPSAVSRARPRGWDVPGRERLEAALGELGGPWTGGPLAEPARQALAAHTVAVHDALAAFDDLAARVAETGAELVVTHGEPHPGNLVRTPDGPALIDWDTVALALPERDLWMLDDGSGEVEARYREATGRAVDGRAISMYRQAWVLTDIALFTALLRSEHARNRGTEKALWALNASLGEPPPPYGPTPTARR